LLSTSSAASAWAASDRARRGEYRVRYLIDEERHQIVVMDVEHRRDAYRT
jgi:mRNA-degrading endonuclease RelE of RelBE toxin-antitoxin system